MERIATPAPAKAGPLVSYSAVAAGLICAAILLAVDLFRSSLYYVLIEPNYLVMHLVLEFISIIVAGSVFAVGWYGYKQNENTQDLYIAVAFMITGALDFAHTLSYQGMPSLLTLNTVSKASTFWIAARFFTALSLLLAAFVRTDSKKPWMKPRVLFPAAAITIAVIVGVIGFYHASLPPMFIPGKGQTPLKIDLEYLIVVLLLLSVLAWGRFSPRERSSVDLIQVALVISIFSELSFVLYRSAFDTFNLLGHLFKVAAYYFILRGLFVSSLQRPYNELITAREELAGLVRETGDLYEQADHQRERLEHSFAQISSALGSSLDVNRTLELIGELAADMIGTEAVAVAVPDEERPVLKIMASRGLASDQKEIPLQNSLASEAIMHRSPKWVGDLPDPPHTYRPALASGEVASILTVPILYEDHVMGVLALYSPKRHAFGEHDAQLLTTFAKQAAVAVDNAARYARERRIAQTFQRRLLPRLPEVEDMDIAARYEPASQTAEVGGDLYDAILLDPTRLALAIGDVSGKGLDAATVMASTQYMMRGFLFQGMQPGEILSSLHSAISKELDPNQFVTVFLSILDLHTLELFYANAGHPFPILMTSEGCQSLTGHNGGPVGALGSAGYYSDRMAVGDHWAVTGSWGYKTDHIALSEPFGLLYYTDGLIEARDGEDFLGENRVLEICTASGALTSDQLVDELLAKAKDFSGSGGLEDDIALLAAKWRGREKK